MTGLFGAPRCTCPWSLVPFPLLLCRYFNSGRAPLECDKDFWELRDSVVQCELLILRQLNFYVCFEHPHKVCAGESVPEARGVCGDVVCVVCVFPQYLLHYLTSVGSLVNRHAWARTPVAETSWALLRDCYHGVMCIRHTPQHIAIATLYLALNSYGVELPVGEKEWWKVRVRLPERNYETNHQTLDWV